MRLPIERLPHVHMSTRSKLLHFGILETSQFQNTILFFMWNLHFRLLPAAGLLVRARKSSSCKPAWGSGQGGIDWTHLNWKRICGPCEVPQQTFSSPHEHPRSQKGKFSHLVHESTQKISTVFWNWDFSRIPKCQTVEGVLMCTWGRCPMGMRPNGPHGQINGGNQAYA